MLTNLHVRGVRPQPEPWHLDMVATMVGVPIVDGRLDYPDDWTVPQSGWQLHPCQHLMVHVPRVHVISKAASVAFSCHDDNDTNAEAPPAKARGAVNIAKKVPNVAAKSDEAPKSEKAQPQTSKRDDPFSIAYAKEKQPVPTGASASADQPLLTPTQAAEFYKVHNMPQPPPPKRGGSSEVDTQSACELGTADGNRDRKKRQRSWASWD